MEDRFLHDATVAQMFYDDPLQQRWSRAGVPLAIGVDHHDRSARTDTKTWGFSALYPFWTEQESLAVQKFRKQLIQMSSRTIGRTEPARAHEDVARIRLHPGER